MKKIETYSIAFWQWIFNKPEIADATGVLVLPTDYHIEVADIFGKRSDNLLIDFERGKAIDRHKDEYSLLEFIARTLNRSLNNIQEDWIIAKFEHFCELQEISKGTNKYEFDQDSLKIIDTSDDDESLVMDCLLHITSIIQRWNLQDRSWEREFVGFIRYKKRGREYNRSFRLAPEETMEVKAFSKAIWRIDALQVYLNKDSHLQQLIKSIMDEQQPKTVIEKDFTGFFMHEKKRYYISKNLLVELPNAANGRILRLIAPNEDGTFPIGGNDYFSLSRQLEYTPFFTLDAPIAGRYIANEGMILVDKDLDKCLREIEKHLCSTIGGSSKHRLWGKAILGYIHNFLNHKTTMRTFNHGIFLYIYGEGNAGKGEVSKIITGFFGGTDSDRVMNPTQAALDMMLMQYADRPLINDEFKPEGYKKFHIPDQTLNGIYERRPRANLSVQSGKKQIEAKEVRTDTLFVSNFMPKTDHFSSRCVVLEYSQHTRGKEQHLTWLKENKPALELSMLSLMNMNHVIDQDALGADMRTLSAMIRKAVKRQISQHTGIKSPTIRDRQVESWAIMIANYLWLWSDYRSYRLEMQNKLRAANNSQAHGKYQTIEDTEWTQYIDQELFDFAVFNVVKHSMKDLTKSPMAAWLNVIAILVRDNIIQANYHYKWLDDGGLAINANFVHEKYKAYMGIREDAVDDNTIRNTFAETYHALADNGLTKVIGYYHETNKIQYRGYRIEEQYIDEALAATFKHPQLDKYLPFDGNDSPLNGKFGGQNFNGQSNGSHDAFDPNIGLPY